MNEAMRLEPTRLWRSHPREFVALGSLAIAGIIALAGSAWSTPTLENLSGAAAPAAATPPAAPPLLMRELAPEDAIAVNKAIPVADGPNPAAKPFSLGAADETTKARALECLTSAVYYEAGSEDTDGQKAVAQVVLNRVRHPVFPATICGVVYEGSTRATGCQFTFTCDGLLARRPVPALWERARKIAWAALNGQVHRPVGNATHYHADYVVPYWASSLTKNAVVGAHIFYRWPGGWGRPNAFSQRYARREPDSQVLRMAAVEADALQQPVTEQEIAEIPGAEVLPAVGPIEDGKRVAVRFKLEAREAVEAAPRVPYVEKMAVSENLRWTLSGSAPSSEAKPLGAPKPAPANSSDPAVDVGGSGAAASQ